jgi:hypothetical protein
MHVESKTERENKEPKRAIPTTDMDEEKRAKLLSEHVDPICKKSSTEMADPMRAKLRKDRAAPKQV